MSQPLVKPAPHTQPALTKEEKKEREKRIADAIERKKQAATAPGVVVPAKKPTLKIPAKLNATTGKSKKEQRKEVNAGRVDDTTTTGAEVSLDKELDASVAKAGKKTKAPKDANTLTVSDVARESGVDPKRARARLRSLGKNAVEGRWPTVTRGTPEHDQLIVDIADPKETDDDDRGEAQDGDDEE